MEVRKGILWYLVNGAMELSWFLGWAMFLSPFSLFRDHRRFCPCRLRDPSLDGKGVADRRCPGD
jgi:hypothetical protein